jgi:soluble lytic murein transglycosylase
MLLSLLPVLSLPLLPSMVDLSASQVWGRLGGMVSPAEPSGTTAALTMGPSTRYSGLEESLVPYEVKLDRIQQILKGFKTGLPPGQERKLVQLIYDESLEYQYDPELILAVIAAESSFYNWSRSHKGAIGLMQIMPTTGISLAKAHNINWMGSVTLFDPYLNIKLGTKYLAMMHDEFGDLQLALTAYNYGPTRVREMIKRCDRLPMGYSRKVMSNYKRFLESNFQPVVES